MSKSKVAKAFKALIPSPATPCVYDDGLDDTEDPSEYLQDDYRSEDVGDGVGILRAEQLPDGTTLLHSRTKSESGGLSTQMSSLTLGDITMYSNGHPANMAPANSIRSFRAPPGPPIAGLQHDRSVGNSERQLSSTSSLTLGSADLSGLIYRGSSGRYRG